MKKYIGLLLVIIICASGLIGCKNGEQNLVEDINDEVNEVEQRKLEDISDTEILSLFIEAQKKLKDIAFAYDENNSKEITVKTGRDQSQYKTTAFKTKAPYETIEERIVAIGEYYKEPLFNYCQVVTDKTVQPEDKLIMIDNEYYFLRHSEDIFAENYKEVVDKKIVKDSIKVTMKSESYGEDSISEHYVYLENDKLKIDNVTNNYLDAEQLENVTDEEILELIVKAENLFSEIYSLVDYNSKIRVDIPSIIEGTEYSFFKKTLEPYETPEKREKALKEYYVDYSMLSKIVDEQTVYGEDHMVKEGEDYYFFPFQLQLNEPDKVISKVIEDDLLTANVRVRKVVGYSEQKYYIVIDSGKLKIDNTKKVELNKNGYRQLNTQITENIYKIFNNIQGNYSIAFKDITESEGVMINSKKMSAASTIKIYVMIEAYNQVQEGKLSLNDKIKITNEMIVGGSGLIQHEPIGSQYTIEELIRLMMVESDNTAANILIDKLGIDNINATIKTLGCLDTEMNRKMMDLDSMNKGIDNYTSVNDLASVLNKLYKGECVSSNYDEKMLDIMKGHQLKSKIPNELPEGTVVAHKSGEMGGIENDAAIVYTDKGAYILCILTDSGTSSEQVMAISDVSRGIYDKFMMYKGE